MSAQQLHALNSINQTTPAYPNWFSSRGGVKAGGLKIQLIIQGNRESPVRITDIQPVVSCHAPLSGTLFFSPTGGEDKNTQLFINLDKPLEPPSYIVIRMGMWLVGVRTISATLPSRLLAVSSLASE
jgi:hypothetical protein